MTWIITGLFNKRSDAERAIEHLVQGWKLTRSGSRSTPLVAQNRAGR